MQPKAAGPQIRFGGALESRKFLCMIGGFGKRVYGNECFHQTLANLSDIWRLFRRLPEFCQSFPGSTQPDFGVTQFAANHGIISRGSSGIAIRGSRFGKPSEIVESIAPQMFTQSAATLVGVGRVQRG